MLCIIGAGNVVAHRLLPALTWHGIDVRDLRVHGTHDDPEQLDVDGVAVRVERHRPEDLAQVAADTDLVPWLATPPFHARRDLLAACTGRRFVCEKPLGMTLDDVHWLEQNPQLLGDAFVLSYYVQEKLAPLLWLTGALTPPKALLGREAAFLDPGADVTPTRASMLLSEGLVRTSGDAVSSWQQGGGMSEFAVHAPAMLGNLGLEVTRTRIGKGAVTFTGPNAWARVVRPGPTSRQVVCETEHGPCRGDGLTRSAHAVTAASVRTAGILEHCPAYGSVTAYALQWLAGANYAGDGRHQLAALRTALA